MKIQIPQKLGLTCYVQYNLLGATGFEPATSSSQSWRSTRLSYAPALKTLPKFWQKKWWLGTGSNRRHADFQSAALPTELPSHLRYPLSAGCAAIIHPFVPFGKQKMIKKEKIIIFMQILTLFSTKSPLSRLSNITNLPLLRFGTVSFEFLGPSHTDTYSRKAAKQRKLLQEMQEPSHKLPCRPKACSLRRHILRSRR